MGVVVFIGIVVIAGIIFCRCEWAYRAALDEKDWTIEFLRVQIEMAKEHDEAREVAATMRSDVSGLELKALALLAGPPTLVKTFVHLTERVSIGCHLDLLKNPVQWEAPRRPTHDEIQRNAALIVLWDRGYIGGVLPAGYGSYAAVASNEAMAVKAVVDRLPRTFKTQLQVEQQLSLALPAVDGGPGRLAFQLRYWSRPPQVASLTETSPDSALPAR